ncbi:MAG: hypothetical protein GF344_10190 [Chitinivibrionales bacterium]|nr:hypothetical protein [Chitinivibrionales bacterium]MBD3357205.1 hypothetical protein [Chitinivibrionales bacterium]
MFRSMFVLGVMACTALPAVDTITDADINAGSVINWQSTDTIFLDGKVFVEEEAILTIHPGTIIKAKHYESFDDFSALIINPGAKIHAVGTPEKPIIFTSELDDLQSTEPINHFGWNGLWGGVVILGKAPTNSADGTGKFYPNRINEWAYGGDESEDNSGELRFVSIRMAGYSQLFSREEPIIEDNSGDRFELAALTLGGVGSGTKINHVEVYNSADDGFRFMGGTVNTKYLCATHCGDNLFDTQEGYRGHNQFWFAYHRKVAVRWAGDNQDVVDFEIHDKPYRRVPTPLFCATHSSGSDNQPISRPIVANATYMAKDFSYFPSIYAETYASPTYVNGFFNDLGPVDVDGYTLMRMEEPDGPLFANNIWSRVLGHGSDFMWNDVCMDTLSKHFRRNGNIMYGSMLYGQQLLTFENEHHVYSQLEPRPYRHIECDSDSNKAFVDLYDIASLDGGSFIDSVGFKGAFNPCTTQVWLRNWTAFDKYGYLAHNDTTFCPPRNCTKNYSLTQRTSQAQFQMNLTQVAGAIRGACTLTESQSITVHLYDARGRVVAAMNLGRREAGRHEFRLSPRGLAAGSYLVRLRAGDRVFNRNVVLVR